MPFIVRPHSAQHAPAPADAPCTSSFREPWQFERATALLAGQRLSGRPIRSTLFNLPGAPR